MGLPADCWMVDVFFTSGQGVGATKCGKKWKKSARKSAQNEKKYISLQRGRYNTFGGGGWQEAGGRVGVARCMLSAWLIAVELFPTCENCAIFNYFSQATRIGGNCSWQGYAGGWVDGGTGDGE